MRFDVPPTDPFGDTISVNAGPMTPPAEATPRLTEPELDVIRNRVANARRPARTWTMEDRHRLLNDYDRLLRVEAAARDLLTAVENAAIEAMLEAEDGSEEPEWQDQLWRAADTARAALDPTAAGEGR